MKILITAATEPTSNMTVGEFIAQAKQIYNEYFPNSECIAGNRRLFGLEYIIIDWLLSADVTECANNIRQNDMFHIAFSIDLEDNTESGKAYEVTIYDNSKRNDMPMPSIVTMDVMHKSYTTKPENKYMVYGRKALPFRKTTGSPEKILATLRKYAQKLHAMLEEDLANDNIHENHADLLRSKL
jgi:hypothetical protein